MTTSPTFTETSETTIAARIRFGLLAQAGWSGGSRVERRPSAMNRLRGQQSDSECKDAGGECDRSGVEEQDQPVRLGGAAAGGGEEEAGGEEDGGGPDGVAGEDVDGAVEAGGIGEDLGDEREDDEDAGVGVAGAGERFLELGRGLLAAHDAEHGKAAK